MLGIGEGWLKRSQGTTQGSTTHRTKERSYNRKVETYEHIER